MEIMQRRIFGDMTDEEWYEFLKFKSHIDKLRNNINPPWPELELMARGAWTFAMAQDYFDLEFAYEIFGKVG